MSTHLGLGYVLRLRNCVHCMFIFTFCFFLKRCYSIKYFYLMHIIWKEMHLTGRWDPNRYYYCGSEWTWKWRSITHSKKLQNWSLTTRYSFVSYQGHPFLWSLNLFQRGVLWHSGKKIWIPIVLLYSLRF